MFERPHHRRIARVLATLDAKRLRAAQCLFGGGTAMALRYGEYRESVDIDFLVSDAAGYRELRHLLTGESGFTGLCRAGGEEIAQARDIRADQYGIRTLLRVDELPIKFEIVLEGRIVLASPGPQDVVCGVATLTSLDFAASKLLANADRWADNGVFNRDLIDLAMLGLTRPALRKAMAKAEEAYGAAISRDLERAIDRLQDRPGWLERCMQALAMGMPKAVLWSKVRSLRRGCAPA